MNDFDLYILSNANLFQAAKIDFWRIFNKNKIAKFYDGYKKGLKFRVVYDRAKEWKKK